MTAAFRQSQKKPFQLHIMHLSHVTLSRHLRTGLYVSRQSTRMHPYVRRDLFYARLVATGDVLMQNRYEAYEVGGKPQRRSYLGHLYQQGH